MKKRVLPICFVLLVLFRTGVCAAENAVVKGGSAVVSAAQTFEYSIAIANNPGLAAWSVELSWDASALSLAEDSLSVGSVFSSGTLLSNYDAGTLRLNWFAAKNVIADGAMVTLKLKAAEGASGDYPITVSCSQENTINASEELIPVTTVNGLVSIKGSPSPQPSNPSPSRPSAPSIQEPPTTPSFTDVPETHWAYEPISLLAQRGIVSGTGDGAFLPDGEVTRAQFVKMLAGLAGADTSHYTTSGFEDVPALAWYLPYVAWAAENGVTTGTSPTTFSPDAPVTREQAATLIYRLMDKLDASLPQENAATPFADAEGISSFATDAVTAMQRAGVLSGLGDGRFDPQGRTSRAAAAKMIAVTLNFLAT